MNVTLRTIKKLAYVAVPASLMAFGFATNANAASIISNGTVQLGVDTFGQLNVPGGSPSLGGTTFPTTNVGLRFLPTGAEATAPGCLCEGWGVADALLGLTGFANNSSGTAGLTGVSFVSDGVNATSVVTAAGIFKVTHAYTPTTTPFLYTAKVTIENISGKTTEVLYRRVMDWDIEPTAFSEVVTIQGTAAATNVTFASNDGFASSNPLAGPSSIGGLTGDFVDAGPQDHGALFDFNFGALAAGASYVFDIFYGGAPTEKAALEALAVVNAEVYSFGQTNFGGANGEPNTFIFAFSGVGGDPIVPGTPIPTPALLPGLIGMGVAALRKRGQEEGESAEA